METTLENENGGDPKVAEKASKKNSLDIFAGRHDDGNCLFWAVALAYLNVCYAASPPRANLIARLQKLIEEPDHVGQSISSLEVHMKNFLRTSNSDFILNEDFENLIKQLRNHTVNFLSQHKEAYSDFMTGDFDQYLKEISVSGTWGGEFEITALCSLLGCDIHVYDKSSNTTLLFKPDMKTAIFPTEDRVTLLLSFENSRYRFNFPETNVQRERRESFYELPSASRFSDGFFATTTDRNDEVNQEDPQPDIKASR
ncbi:hypothetical protein [Rickettsiella endosymbiont of Dermanyssus gallinae]|uniref:hypothetical protein n=1 Tax=Rickettsiella endosymbiont of Dermanyssus gallinae TaxID=2856608 RepID=UPI001C5312D8|nr:hypothetical protein [Rickettsiella endosymbiont of Dermanyssus gallinae]